MTVFFAFAYYYLAAFRPIVFVFYGWTVIKFLLNKPTVSVSEGLLLAFLAFRLVTGFDQIGFFSSILYLRLFWGFIFFYLYFKVNPIRLENTFIFLAIITCSEYVLIHLFPGSIDILPNYLQKEVIKQFYASVNGLGGVFGFGGNRTVTGVILLSFFAYFDQNKIKGKWFCLLGSILCFSGTALILLVVYLVATNFNLLKNKLAGAFILVAVIAFITIIVLGANEIFYRLSWEYVTYIIFKYKVAQIEEAITILDNNTFSTLFGTHVFSGESAEVSGYGISFGDFLWLEFFVQYGLIGMVVIFGFVLVRINHVNRWPILLLLVGTLHYHVIFSVPGQLVLAYFLTRKSIGSEV